MRPGVLRISLAVALAVFASCNLAAEGPRYALIIGNGAYMGGLPQLKNPANDASDVAVSFKRLGFRVELLVDADEPSMEAAAARLADNLSSSPKATGVFYYAGHGVQSQGVNYLIPVDANIPAEAFLKIKALSAQTVLDLMQGAGNKLNLVILDACRDNPFSWSRSTASRGLTVVGVQPPGSIIVFATSAGGTAQDGMGRNGLFTQELLKNLETPGADLDTMLNRTAAGVQKASGNKQNPAIYKQFFETAYLGAPPSASPAVQSAVVTAASGRSEPDFGSVSIAPGSLSVSVASAGTLVFAGRSVDLPAGAKLPIGNLDPRTYDLTVRYADGYTETRTSTVESGQDTYVAFSYKPAAPQPSRPAKDIALPSDFVLVPGGAFTMGSPPNEAGREPWDQGSETQHPVTVSTFAIAKFDVTVGEFRAFADAADYKTSGEADGTGGFISTGSKWEQKADATWRKPNFPQTEQNPVVLVSWYDAVAYCNWRSAQEGEKPCYTIRGAKVSCDFGANGYRLPTEVEWEYAAKGGPASASLAANAVYAGSANLEQVAWYSRNSGAQTHPVGQKAPNSLGLCDMAGNVWQWCWDWYATDSAGSGKDPRGPASGDRRVLRGGSWGRDAQFLRSAFRYGSDPSGRGSHCGFRLVVSQIGQ